MNTPLRRLALVSILYLLAYSVASFLDLWTTRMALMQSGVHEGNAFVTNDQSYLPARALLINLAGGAVMTACVIFAAGRAESVENRWLLHPMASFRVFYFNPWSRAVIGVSPLHMLSVAMAFVVMRLLAAANNLLIYFYGFGPIGELISRIEQYTSPLFAFSVVLIALFYLLAVLVAPLAARIISIWRVGSSDPMRVLGQNPA